MPTTDILGNTAEKTIEPLSAWGWFGWSILAVLLIALCTFLALVFQQSYSKILWVVGLIAGWSIFGATSPLYRAVGPGLTKEWWGITLLLFGLIIGLFILANSFTHTDLPNLVLGLLAPACGVVIAMVYDSMTEHLAFFPLAWKTVGILFVLGCAALGVSALSSRR